jgi:hypothetical protein
MNEATGFPDFLRCLGLAIGSLPRDFQIASVQSYLFERGDVSDKLRVNGGITKNRARSGRHAKRGAEKRRPVQHPVTKQSVNTGAGATVPHLNQRRNTQFRRFPAGCKIGLQGDLLLVRAVLSLVCLKTALGLHGEPA